MPPRRTRASVGSPATQSTLSFATRTSKPGARAPSPGSKPAHRVTKPGSGAAATKKPDAKKLEAALASAAPATAKVEVEVPATEDAESLTVHDVDDDFLQPEEEEEEEEDEDVVAQLQTARALPRAKVTAYWAAKERARKAPRVHQGGLSVEEKVLREFDMSGQFGPSIGINRTDRWKRAFGLGLKPPIEVLAVLVKENEERNTQASGKKAAGKPKSFVVERSIVDELMASRVGTGIEA